MHSGVPAGYRAELVGCKRRNRPSAASSHAGMRIPVASCAKAQQTDSRVRQPGPLMVQRVPKDRLVYRIHQIPRRMSDSYPYYPQPPSLPFTFGNETADGLPTGAELTRLDDGNRKREPSSQQGYTA